ncbi:MAG: hypothetical protein KTR25_19455 [Myxococcales bacterium]|nr:hypothetical protein [Myxococcales bacterium]
MPAGLDQQAAKGDHGSLRPMVPAITSVGPLRYTVGASIRWTAKRNKPCCSRNPLGRTPVPASQRGNAPLRGPWLIL